MAVGTHQRYQFQALFDEGIPFTVDDWNTGSVGDAAEAVQEVTVTGAELGDFVLVASSADVADLGLTAQVTGTDTVTVQLFNVTGGAIDHGTVDIFGVVLKTSDIIRSLT